MLNLNKMIETCIAMGFLEPEAIKEEILRQTEQQIEEEGLKLDEKNLSLLTINNIKRIKNQIIESWNFRINEKGLNELKAKLMIGAEEIQRQSWDLFHKARKHDSKMSCLRTVLKAQERQSKIIGLESGGNNGNVIINDNSQTLNVDSKKLDRNKKLLLKDIVQKTNKLLENK